MQHFTETDPQQVLAFMRQHPFVTLCATGADGYPVATQVPILVKESGGALLLQGHIMRKSAHHLALEQHAEALVMFNGPHSYVSASWYSSPQMASTWNYITVHVKGRVRFLEQEALLQILDETTALFENDPASSAAYAALPRDYVHKMAKGIIAFELEPNNIQNVFKLSQNRDKTSYENIINQLKNRGHDAASISAEMEKRKAQLFPS